MNTLTKDEKIAEIVAKCEAAGCSIDRRKHHFQQFVYERWDCHPPDDFVAWHKQNGQGGNVLTAWNCDSVQQEFYKARSSEMLFKDKEPEPF
jgi:hypothetical protein